MFRRGWEKLDEAKTGGIHLVPQKAIQKDLEANYDVMAGMMFGEAPKFAWIFDELLKIEAHLNAQGCGRAEAESKRPMRMRSAPDAARYTRDVATTAHLSAGERDPFGAQIAIAAGLEPCCETQVFGSRQQARSDGDRTASAPSTIAQFRFGQHPAHPLQRARCVLPVLPTFRRR